MAQQITQLGMCGATPLEEWGMVRSGGDKPSWAIVAFEDVEQRAKLKKNIRRENFMEGTHQKVTQSLDLP